MPTETIQLQDEADRWRFRCPNGHTSWEPTNHHFWCAACSRMEGIDPSFDELHDDVTGDLVKRSQVRLETPAGPYDRDLDAGGSA